MKKNDLEDLLLQEMEEVKGGAGSGTCSCETGAGQGSSLGGECICSKGGAQQLYIKQDPIKCTCTSGAMVYSLPPEPVN